MENEMETMEIRKLSIKLSIPMVISMISIALYGIVDWIFISNTGAAALTTVTLCEPIISIITAIGLGTGIGVNAILAKSLGEKNVEKSKKIIFNGIILIFISWIVILGISILGIKPFFRFFSSNNEIQELGYKYLSIIAMISFGSLYQILFEKILEAYGKSKLSMIVQFSGAVINLILDPILIFGLLNMPKLGISGAAISTVIGQLFGMTLGIIFILKEKIISLAEIKNIKFDIKIIKEIYVVGFPTIIMESANSFISLILNKILISFSDSAVSVWGIYSQLQKFIIIIVYGLNYGMIPIVAYNWGAKKKERITECIRFFLKLAIGVTAIGMALFLIIPENLIGIYDVNQEVMSIAIIAIRVLSLSFIFAAISLVRSATFQAFGNGTYSLIVNLSRKIIFVIPLILILKPFIGIYSIWISFVLAEVITTMIATVLYNKIKKNVIDKI